MTLNEKLTKWWDDTKQRAPEVYEAYIQFVAELKASDVARRSLKRGDRMPAFALPNAEGHLVTSRDLLAKGRLVLSFFRGGWCPYCRMELQALQDIHPELKRRGATLAAVTPDTAAAFVADKHSNALDYEMLSDVDNGVALLFGLTFRVPDFIRALWLRLGIDLGARHGNDRGTWLLPVPATYIIDRNGTIHHAHIDSDFRRRLEPAEILRLLDKGADNGAASKR
jgi:peroxiredoxin